MKWKNLKGLMFLLVFLMVSQLSIAQEYQYHKVYIYNFTKYIQWPTDKQSGDFIIGVYGKSPIINELNAMAASRMVGTQKIVVKEINSANEATGCHVLFIPVSKSDALGDVKTKLGGQSTLIITEKDGLGKQGSGINFVIVEGKLKYELNKSSIDKAGLKVMPDLIKLAILVNS